MRTRTPFDIIEADALRPGSAYAGNLYSEEYFELLLSRLTPGGIAGTWAPAGRVRRTFIRVFPYVVSLPRILLRSNAPIEIDGEAIAARAADRQVQHYQVFRDRPSSDSR